MSSLILRTATRFLMVLLILFSIFMLLRGHNEPGGGFIGGLLIALSFALYGLAYSPSEALELLRFSPRTILGVGLGVAVLGGLTAVFFNEPFLTGIWTKVPVPGIGGKISSVLLFDIGVYLVVLGSTLLILLNLEGD